MREAIFRGLAGLPAVSFVWVALAVPRAEMGWYERFMVGGMALMFGLYAFFGPRPAYWVMWALFGVQSESEQKTGKGKKDSSFTAPHHRLGDPVP